MGRPRESQLGDVLRQFFAALERCERYPSDGEAWFETLDEFAERFFALGVDVGRLDR